MLQGCYNQCMTTPDNEAMHIILYARRKRVGVFCLFVCWELVDEGILSFPIMFPFGDAKVEQRHKVQSTTQISHPIPLHPHHTAEGQFYIITKIAKLVPSFLQIT